MSPLIGITQASFLHHPQSMRENLVRGAYYFAIRQAGGIPRELGIPTDGIVISSDLTNLNGILFTGGGDINPQIYGKESEGLALGIDNQRDAYELALFNLSLEKDIPYLGICRGIQLVNVALGGNLFRDLKQDHPSSGEHDWFPSRQYLPHSVTIEPNSRLHDIGYSNGSMVNSLHHQGIQELGKGLKPIAHARDGVIEAVSLTGHRFGLAVQWHPEWLIDQQPARALFELFIMSCG
ncbi:MAG: gamma-glutamyl-gamma-aminobutyrate hydrolase family protein [Anaerolineaceae bacterium]